MSDHERTERGFRVFGRIPFRGNGVVRVQESSRVFEGAHVWLFLDGVKCDDHLGEHMHPTPHLDVAGARALRDALAEFIAAAERGELMEPEGPTNE